MLKLRVIPCLDVKDGRVVKGVNFVNLRDAGDPVEQAAVYDAAGADELTFLDITASHENRDTILDVVARTAERVFLPLTVGGGVRSTEDMRKLLLAGADKCSMNSAAVARPDLVREAAEKFGSQCVVVAVDARASGSGAWEVFTHGGRKGTGLDAVEWCRHVAAIGRGRDPADQHGPRRDRRGIRPRPAAGRLRRRAGAGRRLRRRRRRSQHFVEGARAGATGLLAASVFHFGTFTVAQVKQALRRGRPAGPSAASGARVSKAAKPAKAKRAPRSQTEGGRVPDGAAASGAAAEILDRLWTVVLARRSADPRQSHSARLLSRGTAKVAQKFGEEAVECLIEAVARNPAALVAESADVLYHLIVLWVAAGVEPAEVWAELHRREGMSGIAEKAARPAAETRKIP